MDESLQSIFNKLSLVLREVFDDDELVATPDLTASMVRGWDSLGNVRLFLDIENAFSIRFSATEIAALRNVGQLADVIMKKLTAAMDRQP